MKMIDPTAMSRFTALREAARKIDHLVPHVRLMEQPPHESRNTTSVALEFPTPLVVLNSTIRQALSLPVLRLRAPCRRTRRSAVSASPSPFPGCGSRRTGINRPSDFEKLSSDKRLAWRALSTLGAQLPSWIPPFLWRRSRQQLACPPPRSRSPFQTATRLPMGPWLR
ncbi:MAG: hypothetical protein ACLU38_07475 [Dysosmobacter sp.]